VKKNGWVLWCNTECVKGFQMQNSLEMCVCDVCVVGGDRTFCRNCKKREGSVLRKSFDYRPLLQNLRGPSPW
jgi:hypothetical protein